MARKIEVQLLGNERDLVRSFRAGGAAGTQFGERMRGVAKAAGLAAAVIGAAFVVAAKKGVTAASDLNEEQSKTRVLFGRSSAAILKWSKTTATSLGLSARAALQATGNFGGMFAALKLGDKSSATMSKRLVKLGADLASFSNQKPEEMLDRLRSGLAGEAEPLRRFGIFISAARVQQEALRIGLVKTGQELTEQQKVQARYSLILRDSAKAQGDFGRTQGGFANQLRIARAQLENISASLGSIFLPAVTSALKGFNDLIADVTKARTVRAKVNVVLDKLKGLAGRLTERLVEGVRAIDWSAVWSKARGIADGLQKQLEAVDFEFVGERIGKAIRQAVDVAIPAAKELGDRLTKAIRAIDFSGLGKKLGPELAAAIVTAFVTLTDPVFWVRNWDLALAVALTAFGGPIGKIAGRIGGIFVGQIAKALARISPRLGEAFRGLAIQAVRFFGVGLQKLAPILGTLLRNVIGVFGRLGKIATFFVKVFGVQAAINAVVDFAKSVGRLFTRLRRTVSNAISGLFAGIKQRALRAALEIVEPFSHLPAFLGGWARKAKTRIVGELNESARGASGATRTIQGHIDGVHGKNVAINITTTLKTVQEGRKHGRARVSEAAVDVAAEQAEKRAANNAAKAQAAAAQAIKDARLASARAVKKAAAAAAKAKKEAITAFGKLMDSLDLDLERAQQSEKRINDDLGVLRRQEKAVLAEIKIEGRTVDLERKLMEIRQQRTELRQGARRGKQFAKLGLTSEGEAKTPSTQALTKRLGSLRAQVKGTTLDTAKTRSQLNRIANVLKGKFGKVGKDVRDAILQMFSDINGALTSGKTAGGPLTKTSSLNTKKLTEGLGLTPEQVRALRSRTSGFNSAGRGLSGRGSTVPTSGSFGGAQAIVVESHTTINLDGKQLTIAVNKELQKIKRRNPKQKRGPHSIGGV